VEALLPIAGQLAMFGAIVLGLIGLRPPPPIENLPADDLITNLRRELIAKKGASYLSLLQLARFFARYVPLFTSDRKLTEIDRRLRQAGRPGALHAVEYVGIWLGIGAVFGVMVEFLCMLAFGFPVVLLGACAFVVIYFSGLNWVEAYARERIGRIEYRLPYVMDLMMISVEAGSTFTGAIELVVADGTDEPLDRELGWMLAEINMGQTRRQAMKRMIERIGSEALADSWNTLLQGEELGVPLARSIKTQARSLRGRRVRRAEKLANEAGTKIMAPSVLIMLAVLLLLLGPVLFRVFSTFPM